MIRVTSLQATGDQSFRVPIADGSVISFRMVFRPRIPAFFLDISWGTFKLYGLKLANTTNLLGHFRKLPFGLCVNLADGTEPYLIDDFTTGRATFNVWEQADLDLIAAATGSS